VGGAFSFFRLAIQSFDLLKYFILRQWYTGLMKSMGYMMGIGKWEYARCGPWLWGHDPHSSYI